MDSATAISAVLTAINLLTKLWPEIVTTSANLKTFGTALYNEFTGTQISDADLAVLESQIDAIHDQLQVPIPPDLPTTPT